LRLVVGEDLNAAAVEQVETARRQELAAVRGLRGPRAAAPNPALSAASRRSSNRAAGVWSAAADA
jgi:hypothetical protein